MAKKEEETPETPAGEPEQAADTAGAEVGPSEEMSKDATNMALLCHLLAIFTGFLGPLIIWLVKKDSSPFIDAHGKEALNFQLTVLIAMFVSGLLTFVCVGFILMPVIGIVDIVFCIIATLNASRGQHYRYPLSIRFIK